MASFARSQTLVDSNNHLLMPKKNPTAQGGVGFFEQPDANKVSASKGIVPQKLRFGIIAVRRL